MSDFWMPTAQAFEQLFDKPKMTEKLLLKPPFRYLHDIFLATLGATGFGNGLFTEAELDSKANHEKDAKINILTKMITITEMMVGEKIDVKPSKIVAGLEPERTNYFLQQLFRAATCGVDSAPYVRQITGEGGDEEAEEEARRQAEAQAAEDEKAKRKAAEEKKKRAEDKKKQEDMLRKRQEEEEDRKRKEQEAQARRDQEEAKARSKTQKAKAEKPSNIIRDGAE
jgi:TRAF3-interacting protein 1